ncbi:MAG: beta-N-acetylhexosaminidase [Saccharospirillum sp.]
MTVTAHCAFLAAESGYRLHIQLQTETGLTTPAQQLCFSLAHPMDEQSLSGARLRERQGDWHCLQLTPDWSGEAPLTLEFCGPGTPFKRTDLPYGLYLVTERGTMAVIAQRQPLRQFAEATPLCGTPQLIPRPQHWETGTENLAWTGEFQLLGEGWQQDWLVRMSQRLTGTNPAVFHSHGFPCALTHEPQLDTACRLAVSNSGAELSYRDPAGRQAAQAYWLQLLLHWQATGRLPSCILAASPHFEYRGIHLDVVRHFFPAETLLAWFDLFALFHYNHFHWHLTDDDAWRVPSNAFPQLAELAGWRGHGLLLPPQMGSGPAPYGGHYSKADIHAVVERAASLGMDVIPEMDIPGHARALLKALPELVEAEDQSVYNSVQHYDDNTLNPALAVTGSVITTLIDEWCALFPGKLFHLGSDEVPEGVWQQSPSVLLWAETHQCPVSDLHGAFMARLEQHLQRRGRVTMGWEEIRTGQAVSPASWILSWQGTEAGKAAAQAGHPVVMTPAQHSYLDLAVSTAEDDPGYYWAGTVNLKQAWAYQPEDGIPFDARRNIRGIQACLWTELISTPEQAEFMWFPRLLALAEVGWGANQYQPFEAFLSASRHWMSLLARMGVRGRSETQGW